MRTLHWLAIAYAPLARRWALVDGNGWQNRRPPRARAPDRNSLWTGIQP